MEAGSTKWERKEKITKTYSRKIRNTLRRKIKEIKISKAGLSTDFLCKIMCDHPNFLGIIPQDYLENIQIMSFPVSLIVNLDTSDKPGSHWISFFITDKTLEIFDSLGFTASSWDKKPLFVLNFIKKLSFTHEIYVAPPLQNPLSNLCGFYCIYFLLWREYYPFSSCISIFTSDLQLNDKILLDQFL